MRKPSTGKSYASPTYGCPDCIHRGYHPIPEHRRVRPGYGINSRELGNSLARILEISYMHSIGDTRFVCLAFYPLFPFSSLPFPSFLDKYLFPAANSFKAR